MNRRILGNILITVAVILVISGFVMYLLPHSKSVSSLHTVFGFLLSFVLIFHIINNRKPLKNYLIAKKEGVKGKIQTLIIIFGVLFLAALIFKDMPGFNTIYNLGNQLRNKQLGKREVTNEYQLINFPVSDNESKISVELKKGKSFGYPLFAIWMEDTAGNYIKTLYISKSINSSVFKKVQDKNGKWRPGIVRRPEALPYWSHKRGIKASDGYYVPLEPAPDLDGSTGATPTSNFEISTGINIDTLTNFRILLEVNQSFDFNEYYTRDAFPEDKIYSGNGFVGQPALVYSVLIDKEQLANQKYFFMLIMGHSHFSGKTGDIYPINDSLTTSLNIIDRLILSVQE